MTDVSQIGEWVAEAGGGAWPLEAHVDLDEDWRLNAVVSWDDEHRVVLRTLQLTPRHEDVPLGGITTSVWRAAVTGDRLAGARALFVEYSQIALQVPTYDWQAPGRTGHPDLAYALVAYHYRAAVLSGARNPVEALAEELGCSRATASTRLSEARKRGLLTSSSGGRSGGRLTAKAKRLLEIQNAEVF